jgi:hypothetical protein
MEYMEDDGVVASAKSPFDSSSGRHAIRHRHSFLDTSEAASGGEMAEVPEVEHQDMRMSLLKVETLDIQGISKGSLAIFKIQSRSPIP